MEILKNPEIKYIPNKYIIGKSFLGSPKYDEDAVLVKNHNLELFNKHKEDTNPFKQKFLLDFGPDQNIGSPVLFENWIFVDNSNFRISLDGTKKEILLNDLSSGEIYFKKNCDGSKLLAQFDDNKVFLFEQDSEEFRFGIEIPKLNGKSSESTFKPYLYFYENYLIGNRKNTSNLILLSSWDLVKNVAKKYTSDKKFILKILNQKTGKYYFYDKKNFKVKVVDKNLEEREYQLIDKKIEYIVPNFDDTLIASFNTNKFLISLWDNEFNHIKDIEIPKPKKQVPKTFAKYHNHIDKVEFLVNSNRMIVLGDHNLCGILDENDYSFIPINGFSYPPTEIQGGPCSILFIEESKTLLVGSYYGEIIAFDENLNIKFRLIGHLNPVTEIQYFKDDSSIEYFITRGGDKTVRVWSNA